MCVCATPQKGFCLTLLFTGEEALRACRSRVCVFSDSRLCTAGNSLFIFIRPNGGWAGEGGRMENQKELHENSSGPEATEIALNARIVKNGKSIEVINKIHFAIK